MLTKMVDEYDEKRYDLKRTIFQETNMIIKESEKVGLKETEVSDLNKGIIAFSYHLGGKLNIGVKDDGTI